MIICIVLWLAGIVLGYFGMVVRELYNPGKRMSDLFLTFFLLSTLGIQLSAIYLTALKTPFLAMLGIMAYDYYWFAFAPFYPNSDAAGNGMARGFRSIFMVIGSFVLGIISYLFMKFLVVEGKPYGIYFILFMAGMMGLSTIFKNRSCYLSGDGLTSEARWHYLDTEDYKNALLRASMVEKNDSWESKDLGAVPEEIEHFNVYGCKCINIRTNGKFPCELLEGFFEYPKENRKARKTGLHFGCLGYTNEIDANDRTIFVPHTMTLAWRDLTNGKNYKIHTGLPKELDRYFEDTDRFWLDDIELRIFPWGKVLMYHNRRNQIHNIMMDYPLMGEETGEYEEDEQSGGNEKSEWNEGIKTPSLDTIEEYLRRYKYTISFTSDENRFQITKTICNFFNGEKILSGGKWEEDMDPSRIKDVFLRFENKQARYAAFIYFKEEEILKAFGELEEKDADFAERNLQIGVTHDEQRNAQNDVLAEFIITCGDTLEAFSFALKTGDNSYELKDTEIRLYKVDEQERGKLVFKNYKGDHKNRRQ